MNDNFIGEIKAFPYFQYVPEGWLLCNGQYLSFYQSQYQALYSLIGNIYAPPNTNVNLQQYFFLPDLQGVVPMGTAPHAVSPNPIIPLGKTGGTESVTLNLSQIPAHNHLIQAVNRSSLTGLTNLPSNRAYLTDGASEKQNEPVVIFSNTILSFNNYLNEESLAPVGSGGAHENRMPFLPLQFAICFDGTYPPRP